MIGTSVRRNAEPLVTYSAAQACALLQCKRYTFNGLVRSGKLRGFKVGQSYAVLERDLVEFIERRSTRTIGTSVSRVARGANAA